MSKPLVLLDSLLPTDAVELGRLVVDIRFPNQDFFQSKEVPVTSEDITTQQLNEFTYSLERTETSGFHILLSTLLSGNRGSENSSDFDVSSSICTTRQLQDSDRFFEKICALRTTRAWLERIIRRRKDAYLITGIKTIIDAQVGTGKKTGTSYEGDVQVPTSLAATAAGIPLPIPDGLLDVGTGAKRSAGISEKTSFVVPGEQVFAVQFRKLRVSWFSGRDVDNTYLESGNRWKVYLGGRGEEKDFEKVVDIEVGEYLQEQDLPRNWKITHVDGEIYLHM